MAGDSICAAKMFFSELIFYYTGLLFTIYFAPRTVCYIVAFFTRSLRRNELVPDEHDYAIITGATDGIGLEYARQLAAKGYNLLLLSRTQSKLEKVRAEILKQNSNIQVEVHAVDFTELDIYDSIKAKLQSIDGRISILVNNVGMLKVVPHEFSESDDGINLKTLICNTVPVTRMCELVLPIMKQQHHGIIINVSSASALMPMPYYSVYSSTKTYMSTLTSLLATEYSSYGITFQDLQPNQVSTSMTFNQLAPVVGVTAQSFVQQALTTVGAEFQTSGHLRHKIVNLFFASRFMPESIAQAGILAFQKMVKKYGPDYIGRMETHKD